MEMPIEETAINPVEEKTPTRTAFNGVVAIAMVLLCLGIGSIGSFGLFASEHYYLAVAVQLTAFLLAGILHVRLTFKQDGTQPMYTLQALQPTAGLAFGIAVCLALLFAFTNPGFLFLSVSGAAAFLLPAVTVFAWWFFQHLVEPQFSPWYLRKNLLDNKAFVFLASVTIRIKLAPQLNDKKSKTFTSTVPVQMEFGKIFHYFVAQQQHRGIPIATDDESGAPLGWHFYVSCSGGHYHVPINPEENLWANQIRPNALVVARRVNLKDYKIREELPSAKTTYALHQHSRK